VKGSTTIINFAAFISLVLPLSIAFSLMTFHLLDHLGLISLLCVFSSVAYPIFLRATRAEVGYLRELLILVLVFVVAFGVSEVVYYCKMEPTHHDFGESFPVLVFFVLWWEGMAVLSFTASYLGSKLMFKSQAKS
jgi:hypothetical protein